MSLKEEAKTTPSPQAGYQLNGYVINQDRKCQEKEYIWLHWILKSKRQLTIFKPQIIILTGT